MTIDRCEIIQLPKIQDPRGNLTFIEGHSMRPDEVRHLGAQSHVMGSSENPEYTGDITVLATTRLLDAIRPSGVATRF